MKKLLVLSVFLFCSWWVNAQTVLTDYLTRSLPKRETRAVWLTTLANLDWPKTYATSEAKIEQQKQELRDILDAYKQANINTVLLQARVRAATIYPSNLEPWDHCITGKEGGNPGHGYDPLAFAVEECHRRGMEIHAWIATIPVGAKTSLGCRTLMKKGFRIKTFSTGSYLDPADPQVAPYLAAICGEITRNYDIDGINLDYIRYPDGWPQPSFKRGDTPDARRQHITSIVKAIHDEVKALKPWVKVSCSPIGKYSDLSRYSSRNFNARDRVAQEAQEWLRLGLMDQLYPMQYFRGENYYPFIADWVENRYGREVVTGLGTYFLDPREGRWTLSDLTRQMYVSRDLGMGHAHFRSYFLTSNKQGIYNFERQFNASLALPPIVFGGKGSALPSRLKGQPLRTNRDEGMTLLQWEGSSPYYNIYVSSTFPVDIKDAKNLLFARYRNTQLMLKNVNPSLFFAITSMSRFGEESEALQERDVNVTQSSTPILLDNDGRWLSLPTKLNEADLRFIEIANLQGRIVQRIDSKQLKEKRLNISKLDNGMYQLKGVNKKRKTYTFGTFMVKRDQLSTLAIP